ncbi:hypothetical protein LY90DRAFT_677090 [Neocallimastix californiae]|uniref:Uncharacterized protein n=1 Tax=Neocallimastix californiae TaxID=1754190 RepID=A0A1Y2AAP9_9FUNG|nr:hypothetical protein LY90DRAFT_677090 [Neocallimastix californiae]|eukprot:ORY19653.1 hypothetical protein LY90DRAFT_677090 [Neocallimastix californiae]
MTLIQYLKDSMDTFQKLELKLTVFEADSYISYLANKYNAYIISNDSDFYIYKVPEYINFKDIIFPGNVEYETFEIKYYSYNNKQIYEHFGLMEEMMPIFGSLCGNDYVNLEHYKELKTYITRYKSKIIFKGINKIKTQYFKRIVIFLLQMYENVKHNNIENNENNKIQRNSNNINDISISSYEDLSNLQKLILEEIFKDTHNIIEEKHRFEFQKTLIDSVREYNPNRKIQKIINKVDIDKKLSKNKFLRMNEKILELYYSNSELPIKDHVSQITNDFGSFSVDQLINHFNLTKDTLPIFASLCGNDKLKITEFSRDFQNHFYSILKDENNNNNRMDSGSMYDYYRNIVNFISNIYDTIQMEKNDKNENELELHEYVYEENKLSPLQKMMNEKIVKNIFNDHLKKFYISVQRKFSKALNKSVIEYNKIFYEEPNNMNSFNKTNNENKNKSPTENETEIETEIETETKTKNPKELAIKAIIDKNEGDSFFCTNEFIKNRVFSLDEQVLESYYASDYNIKLLNILINDHFICIQYFEMIDKQNCWNITEDLRKEMYKIMFNLNIKHSRSKYSDNDETYVIKEFTRKGEDLSNNKLIIKTKEIDELSLNSTNERFIKYLTLFKCKIDDIMDLPYFIIPCLTSLRFLLLKKLETNSFIFNKENSLYSHLSNYIINNNNGNNKENSKRSQDDLNINKEGTQKNINDIKNEETITKLYDYEFEALLASCIAALSFTYLHTNSFLKLKESETDKTSMMTSSEYLIRNHIKKYVTVGYHNLYDDLRYNKSRSLQLIHPWSIECMEDINQLENSIQIYAEYINILNTNTNTLEALKLPIDLPEFRSFTSMYHFQWEQAFHCMVNPFKLSNEKNISSIFHNLFTVTILNNNEDNTSTINPTEYINYLCDLYNKMLTRLILNI